MSDYLGHMAERARASAPAVQPRLRGRFEPAMPGTTWGEASAGAPLPQAQAGDGLDTLDEHLRALSPRHRTGRVSEWPAGPEHVAREERTAPPIAVPLQRLEVTPHAARRDVVPPTPGRKREIARAEPTVDPARSHEGAMQLPGSARPQARLAATGSSVEPRARAVQPGEPAARPGTVQRTASGQPSVAASARAPVADATTSAPGTAAIRPASTPADPVTSRATLPDDAATIAAPFTPQVTARGQGLLVPAPIRVEPIVVPAHAGVPAAPATPGAMAGSGAVAAPAPTIQVTIGRIEVRATALSTPQRKRRPAPAAMSLDEYLDRNTGGQR